jgi:cation transport ATPase
LLTNTACKVFSQVLTIVSALSTRFGTGRHIEALSLSQAEPGLKLLYASRLLYLLVITACKYAFCASYLRIFRERTSRIAILCLTGFITLYTIPIFFATAFPCLPPSNVWHIATTKSCYDGPKADALTYATGLFNVLGDILLLGFVIPQICRSYFIIY